MIDLLLAGVLAATASDGQPRPVIVCPGPDPRCPRPSSPAPVEYQDCWDGTRVSITDLCPARATPQAAVTLIVYFRPGAVALTEEARRVLGEAATLYHRQNRSATVSLAAHTDRHGSADENFALSRQYGEAVRDHLVDLGVPGSAITIQALGESEPLVPTADGEREPQNRRVTIDLSGGPAG